MSRKADVDGGHVGDGPLTSDTMHYSSCSRHQSEDPGGIMQCSWLVLGSRTGLRDTCCFSVSHPSTDPASTALVWLRNLPRTTEARPDIVALRHNNVAS